MTVIPPRLVLVLAGAFLSGLTVTAQETVLAPETVSLEPWRLSDTLRTPSWFTISGSIRARQEVMSQRLVPVIDGENHGFFTRALVKMTARSEFLEATVELIDARGLALPDDALPTTGQVNATDLQQGYVAGQIKGALQRDDSLQLLAGRFTMDLGSRRLVARNRYRNTINAFTGVDAQWRSSDGAFVRAFYTHPVVRRPQNGEVDRLRDNDFELDEARSGRRFWGIFAAVPTFLQDTKAEFYYYGLREEDDVSFATRDRGLSTFGTRWYRLPARSSASWEFEGVYQTGKSRKFVIPGDERLDHNAFFIHATAGYTFNRPELPRLEALFDYVSGDRRQEDRANNQFDSLFGVPRPEYGPTGLFRAVTRSNLISPGVRFSIRPAERWDIFLMQRFNYLASNVDFWTTTGVIDPTGQSGDHIGDLSELRVRYDLINPSIRFEFGVAFHSAGGFSRNAPNGNGQDSLYGYFQTTFTF